LQKDVWIFDIEKISKIDAKDLQKWFEAKITCSFY